MQVACDRIGDSLIVGPAGRVDESSWKDFDSELSSAVVRASRESLRTLVIDLSGIEYMSSRGLRALTAASQQGRAAGVTIRLAAPNEVMREILEISRYDRLFDIDDTVPRASGGL